MHHSYIDKFAYQDSPLHRLDSRIKFLVVLVFTAVVISLPRTSVSILFCFAVGPFAMLVIGRVPLRFAFKHVLLVSPFILVLALTFPFYDKRPVTTVFGPFAWETTLGWMRCFAILGKFVVTALALIALVSTTRFSDLLAGLQKMGVPRLLVIQLGFLYRYIFVLIDSAHHILRARSARAIGRPGFRTELKVAAGMLGSLFVRSIDTAEHINIAMHARGFDGNWRTLSRRQIRTADCLFALAAAAFTFGLYFFVRPLL